MQDIDKEKISENNGEGIEQEQLGAEQPVENLEEVSESAEEKESLEKQEFKEPEPEIKKEEITYAPPPASDDDEKTSILKEADKLREEAVEGRQIEHLLRLAQEKGIGFAIEVAQKTEDPCLIDKFHDVAIEKGLYKNLE